LTGSAGLSFMDDIITLFKDKWTSNGGKLPIFTKKWETKVVNFATKERKIVISLDGENPEIFSLKYMVNSIPTYDWLHTVSISIDIWSGFSEDSVLQMVDEVIRILKTNVVPLIGNTQYIQLLPVGVNPMLEEYRNIWRYTIDAEVMRFNP